MLQHIPNIIIVNASGGPVRAGVCVDSPPKEEVGIGVGVAWRTEDAWPPTGTIVGTNVGVACEVGRAETA
jgi:hypothetical protein